MQEGDIVYYESAKCLHGRMRPLRGSFYVNLFAHYRPVGDPQWFTRDNAHDTPRQLLQLDTCRLVGDVHRCGSAEGDVEMPFLSKPLTTLDGPQSLMDHWRNVAPSEEEVQKVTGMSFHLFLACR